MNLMVINWLRRYWFVPTVIALLFVRDWYHLRFPQPWSEDGTDLLRFALCDRWTSIFNPFSGSLVFLERAVAKFSWLITDHYPFQTMVVVSLLAHCWASLSITSDRLAWLIESRAMRIAICFFLALGPGSIQVAGSAICLIYSLTLLLIIWLLEDRPTWGKARYFFTIAISLSSHVSAFCFALACARGVATKRKFYFFVSGICLANLTLHAWLAASATSTIVTPTTTVPTLLINGILERLIVYSVELVVFGVPIMERFFRSSDSVFFMVLVSALGLALKSQRIATDRERTITFVGFVLSIAMFHGAHMVARNYSIPPTAEPLFFGSSRQSYLGFAAGVICGAALIRKPIFSWPAQLVIFAFIVCAQIGNIIRLWNIEPRACATVVQGFLSDYRTIAGRVIDERDMARTTRALLTAPFNPADGNECELRNAFSSLTFARIDNTAQCTVELNTQR